MKKTILTIFFSICTLLIYAQFIRHDINPDKSLVTGNLFSSVLNFNLKDKIGIVDFEGTLVKRNWILTCAHFTDEGLLPNQTLKIAGKLYTIDTIIIHPDYEGSYNDIALIRLKSEIPEITPMKLYSETVKINDLITIVGIGLSGSGDSGHYFTDTIKRMATNKIEKVTKDWLFIRFDAPGSTNVTDLEGVCGPGNSGGPALIKQDGQFYIVGVSSHSENFGQLEGTYGIFDIYTNVTSPQTFQWIQGTIDAIDFFNEENNQYLFKLISNLPNEDLDRDLLSYLNRKSKKRFIKFNKKCNDYGLISFQKEERKIKLIFKDSQDERECILTFEPGINSGIDNVYYKKKKIVAQSNLNFDLPPELRDRTGLWKLPPTYVSLRISDFFSMCISKSESSVDHFMNNYYESVPGREADMAIFFNGIKNSIEEIENLETVKFKRNKGTVKFTSNGTLWTLSISINDLNPHKINALTITHN